MGQPSFKIITGGLLMFIFGCASQDPSAKQIYMNNYSQTVKTEMQNYHWESPLVQEVQVPAHISNGVFIPEHKELVIIKPGEWVQSSAYPLSSQKESHEQTAQYIQTDMSDLTVLPGGVLGRNDQPRGESGHFTAGVGGAE